MSLTKIESSPVATRPEEPSVALMLQGVIQAGITPENVGALEKLCDLYERQERRSAEKAFASAFVALQADIPSVKATSTIPDNDGNTRSTFAPYEEIMRQVQPLLKKHGFSITFNSAVNDGRVTMTCTLLHAGGHSRDNHFSVSLGKGPPGSSPAQGDGSNATYAKRYALCNALNIVIVGMDDDARAKSYPITQEQAEALRERCIATKADLVKFLAFAKAKTFEEISEDRLPLLEAELSRREAKMKPADDMADHDLL